MSTVENVASSRGAETPAAPARSFLDRIRQHPLIARVKYRLRLAGIYLYDARRYIRHTEESGVFDGDAEAFRLLKAYHSVEKGLALPAPRPGFGRDKILALRQRLARYVEHRGMDRTAWQALHALDAYYAHAREHGIEDNDYTDYRARLAGDAAATHTDGGIREVSRDDVEAAIDFDFDRFVRHRFSIRQYADMPVDLGKVRTAIAQAQKSPSVCNRQSGGVHILANEAMRKKALEIQSGNRGFGETAPLALVVTSDLRSFVEGLGRGPSERNQAWIDGGLFAMSLVYALHAQGLGACMLNWSAHPAKDKQLRALVGIPDQEAIIMMVAVGHLRDHFTVAQSPRRSLDEVMTLHAD